MAWPKLTKNANFGPNLVILGQALPAHLVPCWLVGRWLWRAPVSRKTPIYFMFTVKTTKLNKKLQFILPTVKTTKLN